MHKQDILTFTFVNQFKELPKEQRESIIELLFRNADDIYSPLDGDDSYPPTKERIERDIKPTDSLILVYVNDLLVGFSQLRLDRLVNNYEHIKSSVYVKLSILEPVFRNKGIGNLLYQEIESVNKHILKRQYILRGTWETNKPQLHLYKKFGYSVLDTSTYERNKDLKIYLYGKEISQTDLEA